MGRPRAPAHLAARALLHRLGALPLVVVLAPPLAVEDVESEAGAHGGPRRCRPLPPLLHRPRCCCCSALAAGAANAAARRLGCLQLLSLLTLLLPLARAALECAHV